MEENTHTHEFEEKTSDIQNETAQEIHEEHEELQEEHEKEEESVNDQYSVEAEFNETQENKQVNVDYSYQNQKIIINEAEEEDESPSYKAFFEKNGNPKRVQTEPENEGSEKKDERGPQRWQILYAKALESRAQKEEIRKQYELQKDDPECTFKPRITPHYSSKVHDPDSEYTLAVQDRSKIWIEKREEKRREAVEIIKEREMMGCTFRPDIARSKEPQVITLSAYCSKGVDQYLRRQIIAKQSKDEKEMIMTNPLAKLPTYAYKKEGNITIPKSPDFIKGKNFNINSLKKPLEFPTPKYQSNSPEQTSPVKDGAYQKSVRTMVDPVQVSNVKFGQAVQMLHHELHRFNIN